MEGTQNAVSYFIFEVGEDTFSVPVLRVINVLEWMKATPIPETPGYLEGIVNVRGELLPLVDSRMKFGMEKTDLSGDACILVLDIHSDNETFKIGLIVEKARDVIEVDENEIEKVPDMGLELNPEYVNGVINRGEEIILLLDIDKIFSHKEITEIKKAKENQKD
ncbi:MAG: chemotaxis protein CheW [Bacteroidales bacterium]|nr:chemotaxis protein CheW [Bacteroidales bacterium]